MKRMGIALVVLLLAPFAIAQFRYDIRVIGQYNKLPYFEGARMNNSAQVAGFWRPEESKVYAARWTDGKIDTFYGREGRNASAKAINELGELAGRATQADDGRFTAAMWTAAGEYKELPGLADGELSEAKAINDKGWAVGWAGTADHSRFAPVLWRNGQVLDLGQANEGFELSEAVAINNDGLVVGFELNLPEGPYAAWYWTEAGGIKPMFSQDKQWMTPADVNERGFVTGFGGYIWKDGQIVKMLEGGGGGSSINNSNEVLGYQRSGKPVLWRGNEVIDIGALMDKSYGFTLDTIADLNDAGQILGVGKRADGTYATILLTPVPEPASILALGAGGLWMARRRRRK